MLYEVITGGLEANYQSVNLSANGSVYFSGEDVKPYFSPVFGLNYLRNMIDFTSNYAGSTNDASVTYISNTLQASMGIEGGVFRITSYNVCYTKLLRNKPSLVDSPYEKLPPAVRLRNNFV